LDGCVITNHRFQSLKFIRGNFAGRPFHLATRISARKTLRLPGPRAIKYSICSKLVAVNKLSQQCVLYKEEQNVGAILGVAP
jgi:hypothetical protein